MVVVLYPDAGVNADWTKQTFDFERFTSKEEFVSELAGMGLTLEEFKLLPAWTLVAPAEKRLLEAALMEFNKYHDKAGKFATASGHALDLGDVTGIDHKAILAITTGKNKQQLHDAMVAAGVESAALQKMSSSQQYDALKVLKKVDPAELKAHQDAQVELKAPKKPLDPVHHWKPDVASIAGQKHSGEAIPLIDHAAAQKITTGKTKEQLKQALVDVGVSKQWAAKASGSDLYTVLKYLKGGPAVTGTESISGHHPPSVPQIAVVPKVVIAKVPKPPKESYVSNGGKELEASAAQWRSSLTSYELQAVKNYTNGYYIQVNAYLRKGHVGSTPLSSKDHQQVLKTVDHLDAALAKGHMPRNQIMHRGTSEDPSKLVVGGAIIDKGFVSTSTKSSMGKQWAKTMKSGRVAVHYKLKIPKGTPGAYVNHYSTGVVGEQEFIIQRNAKLRVTKVTPPLNWDGSVDKYGVWNVEAIVEGHE